MKKSILFIVSILIASLSFAQGGGFNYKALITDNGNALANHSVSIKFTVLENGTTSVYQETQTATTDANGIVAVTIGEGTVVSGNFSTIDWGNNSYFLKVEIDTGNGYQDFGTTEFKAVPYAKYADNAGNVFSGDFNDLTNVPVGLSDGDDVNDADADPANELQNLTLSGTQLSISNGNNVNFTNWDTDKTDDVQFINDLIDARTFTNNIFLGYEAGSNSTNISDLTALGSGAMYNVTSAISSVGIGNNALYSLTTGHYNVAIGKNAGYSVTTNGSNVFIGHNAGSSATGSGNVFIGYEAGHYETGDNKLYIENSYSPNPLIGGDFATDEVTVNGTLTVSEKLKAPLSGSADMKAYIYGYIFTTGTINAARSSSGFSVSRIATGKYKIVFQTSLPVSSYIVIANSFASSNPEFLTISDYTLNSFVINSWNLSGNHQNTDFQFVVYKK